MVATLLAIFSQFSSTMAGNKERSFIMVKPDGVQRGLAGEIIKRFNNRGYKLVACKMLHVGDRDHFLQFSFLTYESFNRLNNFINGVNILQDEREHRGEGGVVILEC